MTSDKFDDLDDLKKAMAQATPTPDAARKADVMARSMEIFDRAQGSQDAARQSSETPESRGIFRGAFDMLISKTTGALTATTALVAVGVLFLSPQGQQLLQGPIAMDGPTTPVVEGPSETRVREASAPESVTAAVDGAAYGELAAEPTAPPPMIAAEMPESDSAAPAREPRVAAPAPSGGLTGLTAATPAQQGYGNTQPQGRLAPSAVDTVLAPAPLTEEFANADANPLQIVAEDPVSTFSIDVDTASYALLRSTLNRGQLPASDAVRIEEMVNYFPYDYPAPTEEDISPFRPTVQVFETPWNPDTQLLHIGIQGEMPVVEDRPPLNLVFLIDTSGSMNDPAKLPLLIQSFRLMLDRLSPEDEVAIVTYAGSARVALAPTPASDTATISAALTALQAGGSTNGVGGLEEAYRLAAEMSEEGDVSRVLLATDGDFNVGLDDPDALEDYIARQRETGIYLSVLGFGRGNLQDDTMQALAQNGNGTAAYIDTLHEAQRVLVDQLAGALFPIADDLKVQVEFNPEVIAEYRLIGYETRALAREDFANDAVDAGDIGAGHSVTAIYEVTPVGSPAILVAPLRYAADEGDTEAAPGFDDELGFISLRWKEPGEEDSQLVDFPIPAAASEPGTEAQFAAAIAGFGQLLRGSDFLGDWDYADAIALANANRGADEFGYRAEAVQLMRLAESLAQ
ncbi:VWA domain-containing protein [Gymnodinialimonas ceratoperidinii]|uniref:von Willebrand factor type A domain-containing protein n=1 Tax=Gymnodinialimonas ceratoperidinii TaxID=2856823 RepID=A0A8F6TXW6_9RHOB|nr:VWA domain-containing protein [Gymnodinialimonas ceratoperidinii]QXT40483.1 von Willebrand factor type A domain-containing protein [Gymnodinialimonas ceratoperidinii]